MKMEDIRTIRDTFKELLQLLSSKSEQEQYQLDVPIADVPAELRCLWFDDKYHPEDESFKQAFTQKEQLLLKQFNDFYDIRTKFLPETLPALMEDPIWDEIVIKAKETLDAIILIFTRKSGHGVKPPSCKAHTDKGSYTVERNDDVVYYKIFQCIQRG